MDKAMEDRLAVRELVENWALYRDSGDWERFRAVWHDDGIMQATWTQGGPDMFIEMSTKVFLSDVSIIHTLNGTTVDVVGDRAIAQTKMTIGQRAPVHDVWCDVVCTGRFYDFIERRDGKWGFVLRQPIYEKDRMDPIDPAAKLELDQDLLNSFPVGYRHLAYLQSGLGFDIKKDMPGLKGAIVEKLYARGKMWLDGDPRHPVETA